MGEGWMLDQAGRSCKVVVWGMVAEEAKKHHHLRSSGPWNSPVKQS